MADVPIKAGGVHAAPLTYTLADAAEFIPRTVKATFDGTSAASAFYPTLVLKSAGGLEVARIPTSSSVAAGGSAEVTWFPRVGGAGGGAGAGLSFIYVKMFGVSLTSGTSMNAFSLSGGGLYWGTDAGASTPSSYFDIQDSGGGVYGVAVLQNGSYLASWTALLNYGPTAPAANSVVQIGSFGQAWDNIKPILSGAYYAQPTATNFYEEGFAPTITVPTAGQNSGATKSIDFYLTIFRINDYENI